MMSLATTQAANPWLSHAVRIRAITAEIPEVATYHLEFLAAAAQDNYQCRPGQFNMLYLPGVGEVAISVSGHDAAQATWAHTIRTAGRATHELERLGVGGQLGLRGPFGTSWPMEECRGRDVMILAGGIGLAPLRPAIDAILTDRSHFGRAVLFYGARTPDTLLYERDFTQWTRRGLEVQVTVDRATASWHGNVGVVPLLFNRFRLPRPAETIVLTCGPEVMMRYSAFSAFDHGLRPAQVYLSLERNMQCAVGLCGHCQLGPAFICKDGPVFRYDRIAPFMNVENL